MSKKLYIGGLAYAATEADVRRAFERFGEVLSINIIDKTTPEGQRRKFAFVEMPDSDADAAKEGLNGEQVAGRNITVADALPQTQRPQNSGNGYHPARRAGDSGFQQGNRRDYGNHNDNDDSEY